MCCTYYKHRKVLHIYMKIYHYDTKEGVLTGLPGIPISPFSPAGPYRPYDKKSWNERQCELTGEWSGGRGFSLKLFCYISVGILDRNAETLTGGPTGPGSPLSPYRQKPDQFQQHMDHHDTHLDMKSSNILYTVKSLCVFVWERQNR